eukprot:CAMPEP_0119555088 /NCGR_PEP_ID=MMETSP1352-20130426/7408_1 /TAXON_ID=265584 /ORGANISM="Stauroneis constricta, Strain CCMP1120" /LENGTH=319 /DNA_ID=CAMNT_0007601799 /DNA_START=62 /DNA_END=1018 /DNA_ORIENTATION=-
MSAGYASRLSDYPRKGICGLPENVDTKRNLTTKLNQLVKLVREAKHLVILTGAGISTSAGIPDFRGPKGIWTLEQKREKAAKREQRKKRKLNASNATTNGQDGEEKEKEGAPKNDAVPSFDFSKANPTLTHKAITALAKRGILKFCITQNVDGLHRRSGLSRDKHAVLHGCAFTEQCSVCKTEHFRDFDTGGMSFKPTGRKCEVESCGGDLLDTLLDWEDLLPEDDLERSESHCEKSDLALCLGTSLRIEPAGSLPTYAKRYVIVNLQQTPKDDGASLIIRAPVDTVMKHLLEQLGVDSDEWQNENDDNDEKPAIERLW